MQKSEAYEGIKPGRNISMMPTAHVVELSQFTLAMKNEILKYCDWYGPGLNPRRTAAAIETLRMISTRLAVKDFSSFDATVSQGLFEKLVFPICMEWCHPSQQPLFAQLLERETRARATTLQA